MRAIVTVVGKDKKGIIYCVSKSLSEMNINVEDISQTILQGYFTMMMIVDISECKLSFEEISERLSRVGSENSVTVRIQHEDIFNCMHKL